MASSLISYSLPPNVDPTKAPLAFGSKALPKLNRELNDASLITRQRALMTLCDLAHNPEKINEAIQVGCINSLKKLLGDKDSTVRHKTTEVLYIMVSHNVGRNSLLDYNVIPELAKLFDDEVSIVRKNAHLCIEMLSEIPDGAQGVVKSKLVPKLVDKLESEMDEIKELILDTLHFCMHVDPESALNAGIMPVLKDLLVHEFTVVRSRASRDMMDVTVPLAGKNAACEDTEIIPALVKLLSDVDDDVQARAAGALMTITITTNGKYKTLAANAIPSLLKLLKDSENSETKLNALKAITTLAEAPEGRKIMLDHVDVIETCRQGSSKAVARASEIAVNVITWKP